MSPKTRVYGVLFRGLLIYSDPKTWMLWLSLSQPTNVTPITLIAAGISALIANFGTTKLCWFLYHVWSWCSRFPASIDITYPYAWRLHHCWASWSIQEHLQQTTLKKQWRQRVERLGWVLQVKRAWILFFYALLKEVEHLLHTKANILVFAFSTTKSCWKQWEKSWIVIFLFILMGTTFSID